MKIYLVDNINLIPKMKRLIRLKADLGLCAWSKDFSDSKYDIQGLIDIIEEKLDGIKGNSQILKELSDEEDMAYFECVNKDATISRLLDTGIIESQTKDLLMQNCPSVLTDVIEKISESSFIWVV